MFKEELLENLNKKFDLRLQHTPLLEKAFIHSSYSEHHIDSNQRLEFLGDAVLGLLVAEYIYKKFPEYEEGQLHKLRATYICEEANARYAKELELENLLLLSKGEEMNGARSRASVLSDVFESFLGAVYLETGLKTVEKILKQVVYPQITDKRDIPFIDYKSKLQEILQAEAHSMLEYRLDDVKGEPHKREFTMSAVLDGICLGTGVGRSKKEATQLAAKQALEKMVVNKQ